MHRTFALLFAIIASLSAYPVEAAAAEDLGFKTPPGFAVSLYAGDDLAHDIYSMTIDAHGRVVVAGRGYVKILHDDNNDGKADRATLFSSKPASGAHGMYFDGDDLICTGDDALMKLRDANSDGVADGDPEIWSHLKSSEHGANGIVKGPDGWFYVACGNDAEVSEKHATTKTSPVTKPQCGAIVRFSPDGKQSEIFAHGFRNPYDLDFNADGRLFTVDADGERDQYLPWYAPCRLFDVQQGAHHGWVLRGWTRSWNRPEYFSDNVERLVEIGRGSPTGFVIYRHHQFPKQYRDGAFRACWTLGKIYYFPLTPSGSSYKSSKQVFMETTGTTGFAPVDLAVGPDGSLFVAIGGRGTRGSVFRVQYTGKRDDAPAAKDASDVDRVLLADQPLASWSRAKWQPAAKELGAKPFVGVLMNDKQPDAERRLRAAQVIDELDFPAEDEDLRIAVRSGNQRVASAAMMLVGSMHARAENTNLPNLMAGSVMSWSRDSQLSTARAAWELYQSLQDETAYIENPDSRVRELSLKVQHRSQNGRPDDSEYPTLVKSAAQTPAGKAREQAVSEAISNCQLAMGEDYSLPDDAIQALCALKSLTRDGRTACRAARLLELAIGDVRTTEQQPDFYAGYARSSARPISAAARQAIEKQLRTAIESSYEPANFESARLASMLESDDPAIALHVALGPRSKSSPADDLHYLIVLSRLPAPRDPTITLLTAEALLVLHSKMSDRHWEPSRNWGLVVGELFDELCKRDAKLAETMVARQRFGLPQHSLFAERMQGEVKAAAAQRLIDYAKAHDEVRWTPEMVGVVAALPADKALPLLREQWGEAPELRDAIALVLAKQPAAMDRPRLVTSLGSTQSEVVRAAASALRGMATPGSAEEIGAAMATLRAYTTPGRGDQRALRAVREELAKLLGQWSNSAVAAIDEGPEKGSNKTVPKASDIAAAYQPWFAWFAKTYPDESKRLAQSPGVDAASWAKRVAKIDWEHGDAARGKTVFAARSCIACHGGNGPLGPDLAGAGKRFARDDLLAAIYDPNRDVSPAYQTTQVTTRTGQTYFGLLVYESPEGSLVQTGPDTTLRITDEDPAARRPSKQSLMPTGLLDRVSDAEVADLVKYLQSK